MWYNRRDITTKGAFVILKLNTYWGLPIKSSQNGCSREICASTPLPDPEDTAFLCRLVGPQDGCWRWTSSSRRSVRPERCSRRRTGPDWRPVVLDSQQHRPLCPAGERGLSPLTSAICRRHHTVFTHPCHQHPCHRKGTEPAASGGGIEPGNVTYGGDSGFERRDALMEYFRTIDVRQYTVLITEFANRPNNPPHPGFILNKFKCGKCVTKSIQNVL